MELNVGEAGVEQLARMYESMVRVRIAEERIADLVEAGEIGCPCHLYIGQEAVAAGVCEALTVDDYVWGGHRSHGHYLSKGGSLDGMIAEIFGKVTGCAEGRGGSMHLFAPEVGILGTVPLVAATIPLSVGAALASKIRRDGRVSVAFFGDGATEEGHFHESVNIAAVYKLPAIFVCENNFYASHLALLERRAEDNIVKTATAHGIDGVSVDGNDVVAMYDAAAAAVERARAGRGPTLIEARTYRWRGHVGASWDMDVGVQRKDELSEWKPKDPVARAAARLQTLGWTADQLAAVGERVHAAVEKAIEKARLAPMPGTSELYAHVFHTDQGGR
jgi:acetoin:2,6-dichlorophenolindophenol oxidoreductase subunit alpha